MKEVYEVIFDNGEGYEDHDYWTVAVCSSKEKAEEIARLKTEEFSKKNARAHELSKTRELTQEEEAEEAELYCPYLWYEDSPWKYYVSGGTIPYYE